MTTPHRRPPQTRDPKKPLAANIGFRAPKDVRDQLLQLSNMTGWSCNHIVVDLVQAGLDQIMYPDKPLHRTILMGRTYCNSLREVKEYGSNKK